MNPLCPAPMSKGGNTGKSIENFRFYNGLVQQMTVIRLMKTVPSAKLECNEFPSVVIIPLRIHFAG